MSIVILMTSFVAETMCIGIIVIVQVKIINYIINLSVFSDYDNKRPEF